MTETFNIDQAMRHTDEYLTWGEIEKLIAAAKNDRDKLLISVLARTGRRISEVLLLVPKDIFFDEDSVYFRVFKKKKPTRRRFALNDKLKVELMAYLNKYHLKPDERIFPFTRIRAYQIIRTAGEKTGLEEIGTHKIHPHIMRHSFAIQFVKKATSSSAMFKLQDLLAHSKMTTTAVYAQFGNKDIKEDLDKMDDE